MRRVVLGMIKTYQVTISPDHGVLKTMHPYGYCRYYPTCSDYAHQAVEKYGVGRGGVLAIKRLGRCHPWSAGGIDLLPDLEKKG